MNVVFWTKKGGKNKKSGMKKKGVVKNKSDPIFFTVEKKINRIIFCGENDATGFLKNPVGSVEGEKKRNE